MKKYFFAITLAIASVTSHAAMDLDLLRNAVQTGNINALNNLQPQFEGTALEMYPRYYALNLQIRQVSEGEVAAFLTKYADSSLAERLRSDWLKELARREDWQSYLIEYPALSSPNVEQTCNFLRAELLQGKTQSLTAQKKLWFSAKPQPDACNAAFNNMFAQGILTQDDAWQRIRMALAAGRTDFAGQLAVRAPGLSAVQIRQVLQNPQKKLAELDFSTRAGQELAIFALNRLARSNPDNAASVLTQYQAELPQPIAKAAWGQIALFAAKKLSPQALGWYKKADITTLAEEERSWMARMAIRENDWVSTRQAIEAMPRAEQQLPVWRYWYGRALLGLNKTQDARPIFQELTKDTGYYGLLAREELGDVLEAMPDAFTPSDSQIESMKKEPGINRALILYANANWRSEAAREWNWAMRKLSDEELLAASALAYKAGWYDRAIYSAERTQQTHNYSMRFPLPEQYKQYIRQYAAQHGVDEAWVYGLIRQESRFAPVARSYVGASGLMQIMPATAKWIASRMGLAGFDWRAVYEPVMNIQFGTYYLSYVFNRLDNNSIMATAGYNAGPNRPKNWLAGQELEGAKWIESIPFDETRDYVKKVMANSIHYGQQINRKSSLLKQRLGTVPAR